MPLARRPEQFAASQRRLFRPCLLLGAATLAAHAQGPVDGGLAGRVVDAARRPLPGASVTVRSQDSGVTRTLVTGPDGSFALPGLPPGGYAVTVLPPASNSLSLTALRLEPVAVTLGQTRTLEAVLRPTAEPETVTVTPTDAPEPPSDGVATTFADPDAVPTLQRRWQDAALLSPGIAPDENADGLLSVHGLPATQNSTLIDGADTTQVYGAVPAGTGSDPAAPSPDDDSDAAEQTTGPAYGLARGRRAGAVNGFSQGAVREFRVASPGYSAQLGRAAGAVVTTVSRSGGDHLHGSVAGWLRSSAVAAKNPFSIATRYAGGGVVTSEVVKPHDLRETFLLSLGGPVPRLAPRTLRFFYTGEWTRRGFPAISSPANPDFFRLSASQRAQLATRGLSAAQVDAGLLYLSSLTGPVDRRHDQTVHFGRVDWQASPRLSLGAAWNRVRWSSPAGLQASPVVARGRGSLGSSVGSLDTVLARATAVLTPRTVNELRLTFTRDLQFEQAQTPLPQEPSIGPSGTPGQLQPPEVVIGPNGFAFGTPAGLSRRAYPDEQRYEATDTLTLARGRHLVTLGGSAALTDIRVATLGNPAGTFRYDSGSGAGSNGLVDFLADQIFNVNTIPNGACPSISAPVHVFCFRSFTQSFGQAETSFRLQDFAGFAEDTWRPLPTLTLHAGLRYDYLLLPTPQTPNPALDSVFGAQGATGVFPEDRNNFGPRVSAAWQVPRLPITLHAGYGLFYGRLPGAMVRAELTDTAQLAATTRIRILPTAITSCPQVPANGFGYPCAFLAPPTGVLGTTTSAVVFDRRFRLPAIQQGSLSLAGTLGRGVQWTLGTLFNLDRQLPTTTDLNIAPSTRSMRYRLVGGTSAPGVQDGFTFTLPLYDTRVAPAFGPVTQIRSSANASYYALVAGVTARPMPGLSLRAGYTWAKALDYGPNAGATPRTNAQLDPYTNGYDKARSSLDYPHLLHLSGVYTPRLREGARAALRQGSGGYPLSALGHALTMAANGWELAGTMSARSGRPYSLDLFGGTRLSGGHSSLNGSGGALYLPTVGRNTERLPAWINVDLRVARGFRLGSHVQVRAGVEAFNLFNHRNLTAVVQRAFVVGTPVAGVTPLTFQDAAGIAAAGTNNQPFGTPSASGSGLSRERQVQFTLRAQF